MAHHRDDRRRRSPSSLPEHQRRSLPTPAWIGLSVLAGAGARWVRRGAPRPPTMEDVGSWGAEVAPANAADDPHRPSARTGRPWPASPGTTHPSPTDTSIVPEIYAPRQMTRPATVGPRITRIAVCMALRTPAACGHAQPRRRYRGERPRRACASTLDAGAARGAPRMVPVHRR
jgi:hypothetical protein